VQTVTDNRRLLNELRQHVLGIRFVR